MSVLWEFNNLLLLLDQAVQFLMGMKILTYIFFSRSRKREGLEDMELH